MIKSWTRETQLQAVQNKFDHTLNSLLHSLSFAPVPGATTLNLPHRWMRATRVGCRRCRAVSTSCYNSTPDVVATAIDGRVTLEITMAACERCHFMKAECSLDGASMEAIGVWTDSCRGYWHADNVFVEREGYRHSEAVDARLPSKCRLVFSRSQQQLLSDIFDAADRLERVKGYDRPNSGSIDTATKPG